MQNHITPHLYPVKCAVTDPPNTHLASPRAPRKPGQTAAHKPFPHVLRRRCSISRGRNNASAERRNGDHLTSPRTPTSLTSVPVKPPRAASSISQPLPPARPAATALPARSSPRCQRSAAGGGAAATAGGARSRLRALHTPLVELKFPSSARCDNKHLTYRSRLSLKVFPAARGP